MTALKKIILIAGAVGVAVYLLLALFAALFSLGQIVASR